jgi:hypothetical protein
MPTRLSSAPLASAPQNKSLPEDAKFDPYVSPRLSSAPLASATQNTKSLPEDVKFNACVSGRSQSGGMNMVRLQAKPLTSPQATVLLESARCEAITRQAPTTPQITPRRVFRSQSVPDPEACVPSSATTVPSSRTSSGGCRSHLAPNRIGVPAVVAPNPGSGRWAFRR